MRAGGNPGPFVGFESWSTHQERRPSRGLDARRWGIFNLVEGVIDHTILGLHHVREGGNELPWDLGFLALGVVLIVGGWLLVRSGANA